MHHDPLCDEGVAYAHRLIDEGAEVMHIHFSNHMHGLINMGGLIRDAEAAITIIVGAVRSALRPRPNAEAKPEHE
jgi:acetyl esterase